MTFKVCRVLCQRTQNTVLLRKVKEVQVVVSREKCREIATFCSIICEFLILLCIHPIIRPWHDAQAVARAYAITRANQEKGGWLGDEKPILI